MLSLNRRLEVSYEANSHRYGDNIQKQKRALYALCEIMGWGNEYYSKWSKKIEEGEYTFPL